MNGTCTGAAPGLQRSPERRGPVAWLLAAIGALLISFGCGSPTTGSRCVEHRDCSWLPEGYCARAGICTRVCGVGALVPGCPEGSVCSVQGARSVCLALCADTSACVAGFTCRPVPMASLAVVPDAGVDADADADAGTPSDPSAAATANACVVIDGLATVDAGR